MQEQINQLNYIVSKLKAEVAEKDNLIGRSVTSNDGELKTLRQQLEAKKAENAQLQGSVRDLRMNIKDVEADGERKRRELAERCYSLETEARRYKEEYTRLAEILKSKINSTIDNVSYKKWFHLRIYSKHKIYSYAGLQAPAIIIANGKAAQTAYHCWSQVLPHEQGEQAPSGEPSWKYNPSHLGELDYLLGRREIDLMRKRKAKEIE